MKGLNFLKRVRFRRSTWSGEAYLGVFAKWDEHYNGVWGVGLLVGPWIFSLETEGDWNEDRNERFLWKYQQDAETRSGAAGARGFHSPEADEMEAQSNGRKL